VFYNHIDEIRFTRGKKSDGYMRILTEKKLSLDILDTQTNIGSWVKGHSLGYSIKIKKNSRKKYLRKQHIHNL
jgi:hypothetical protein